VATPQTAPEAAIPTVMTASPTSSDHVDSEMEGILAARVPAERLDDKVTAEALKQRGVKVVLAAGGLPVASGEPPVAQKVTNELLLHCVEAVALILLVHGSALKQLDAFKRASKEKVAYLVLDAVGAALVEPAEAERLGKRVQERVRTVNESLEEEEKFAKAKAKAAER
jgi:hypothetical protein